MKKVLLLTAVASVAFASCVKDEASNLEKQVNQKITFDSPVLYGNVNSRANVQGEVGTHTYGGINYSYPREENFMIYAVSHTGDFAGWNSATVAAFNNTSISYDDQVDGWAPKTAGGGYYYWENGKKMTFAASSPTDLEQTNWGSEDKRSYGATGLIITDFEVPANASHQYDLLFSTRSCNNTSANMDHSASYYSGIPVAFQHALSSIRFSIRNTSPETVVLTGITLKGVKYKGTFNENITENAADYTRYDRTPSTGNVNPAWTVADAKIASPYIAFEGAVQFKENANYVSQLVAEAVEGGITTNVCNQLLLMPQELTDDVTLEVNYTVNGNANTKEVKLKGLESVKNEGKADELKTAINTWEMGKRYTYRLYYSSSTADKDKIYFAPSTDDWQEVDIIVVPL